MLLETIHRPADLRGLDPDELTTLATEIRSFIVQATSTGYVALTAESGRTSAIGFYAASYYVGGSIGAILPGLTWSTGGWAACVGMVVVVQAFMATVIAVYWKR